MSLTNEFNAILQTAVMFGVVSLVVYFALFRAVREEPPNNAAVAAGARGAAQAAQPRVGRNEKPDSDLKIKCSRVPPHLSEASAKNTHSGGANVLSDGIVAFRHSKVASYESNLSPETQAKNRKERAKVLSNLLAESNSTLSTPPVKGGSVVVSVPMDEIDCEKLRRVVYLLATYYTLLMIVNVDSSVTPSDMKDVQQRLRGSPNDSDFLSSDIIPDHRITASSSTTGRVAFVRQLQRIEMVLDFNAEVKDSLSRFGHRVILYGTAFEQTSTDSKSRLGAALL